MTRPSDVSRFYLCCVDTLLTPLLASQSRLEIELTTRRALAYLSGAQTLPLLSDILYPNEKEFFCAKYRIAFARTGEAVRHANPKIKAAILNAVRRSGFTKEDLREMGWTFSTNLWNVGTGLGGGEPVQTTFSIKHFIFSVQRHHKSSSFYCYHPRANYRVVTITKQKMHSSMLPLYSGFLMHIPTPRVIRIPQCDDNFSG